MNLTLPSIASTKASSMTWGHFVAFLGERRVKRTRPTYLRIPARGRITIFALIARPSMNGARLRGETAIGDTLERSFVYTRTEAAADAVLGSM